MEARPHQRVYLDTSVFSALVDERSSDRMAQTEAFWARRERFHFFTSDMARVEARQTPEALRRNRIEAVVATVDVFPVTLPVRRLARQYIQAGVFTPAMLRDAIHVAAAVLSDCPFLISWNFRHLVNVTRRAALSSFHHAQNLPTIDIVSPPELW